MDAHSAHDPQGTRELSAYAPSGTRTRTRLRPEGRSPLAWLLHDARPLLPVRAHAVVPLLVALGWIALMRAVPGRLDEMSDIGLVSVLPISALVLLALLTASFCLSLARRPVGWVVPLLHVLVLIGALYGVTTLVESHPHMETVYRHVGVMDYLLRHRGVDPNIDAYFNWPGFFAFGASLTKVAGFGSPLAFGAWGALTFNLLFLAPLVAIFRWATDDARLSWTAVWVFYVANWVGQDYISPQATGFALWLAILVILLRYFTPPASETAARSRIARVLRRIVRVDAATVEETPSTTAASGPRVGLLLLGVGIFIAIVAGHQLTPFAVALTVTGLVLLARLETRTLPVVMVLITGAWLTYIATAYLAGNIHSLTGSVGSVGGNFDQTVTGRLRGSDEHMLVVHARLFASAGIWTLGLLGFIRHLRAGRCNMALIAVGLAPFLLPALQPYGGEMLLRVYLFALPATAFFIACLAFPGPTKGRSWMALTALACGLCALLGSFMITRYGNERLDYFRPGDVQAVRYVYDHAAPGSTIIGGGTNMPWRNQDYETMDYLVIPDLDGWLNPCIGSLITSQCSPRPKPAEITSEILKLSADRGSWVIITESTKVQASLLFGVRDSLDGVVRELRTTPRAREVLRTPDADVFQIAPAP
jgi:hypothetical protein